MADSTPNLPTGTPPAAPGTPPPPIKPKPGESGKIQPKKETVRINLPPKPTAAPTIKIPAPAAIHAATPGAGAATAAPAGAAAAPVAAPRAAAPAAPAAAQKPAVAAAPALAPASPAPARPAAAPIVYGGGLDLVDKILAIAAAVVAIAVLVRVYMLAS